MLMFRADSSDSDSARNEASGKRKQITPIVRTTLADTVTSRVRELITQGAYEPGAQLSELDLAARFGVSRGPVREGLSRLVQEGLLRSEAHRGVFVPLLDAQDIVDIYFVREAMERAAVVRIFEGDRAFVARALSAVLADMRSAASENRWVEFIELDIVFHKKLVDAAASPRLSKIYATLIDETRVSASLTLDYPGRDQLADQHQYVVEHIAHGTLDNALHSLNHHFRDSALSLKSKPPERGADAAF
jgi:DNA-binding GntR family transcriptional regulator